jgi:hypothetical protein
MLSVDGAGCGRIVGQATSGKHCILEQNDAVETIFPLNFIRAPPAYGKSPTKIRVCRFLQPPVRCRTVYGVRVDLQYSNVLFCLHHLQTKKFLNSWSSLLTMLMEHGGRWKVDD